MKRFTKEICSDNVIFITLKINNVMNFTKRSDEMYKSDKDMIHRLKKLSSTLVADGMDYENVMNYKIKPVNFQKTLVGQARTVSTYPGDNLYIHYGIYESEPGDILVVEGKGAVDSAYLGNLMAAAAQKLGIEGIIIDGLIRDKDEISKMDIQVYAQGFTPKGPRKEGPGSFDKTIECGRVVVNSHDYIIADEDGVVVIPYDIAEGVITGAEEKKVYEAQRLKTINESSEKEEIEPSWLRETINRKKQ